MGGLWGDLELRALRVLKGSAFRSVGFYGFRASGVYGLSNSLRTPPKVP